MVRGMLDRETARGADPAPARSTPCSCMFTDLQGRFMGKRVLPRLLPGGDPRASEGLHACLYLLAIDMEMEPLPGYEYASWETGYGDFRMVPDMSTLRPCPWLEKTAHGHLRRLRRGDRRARRGRAAPDPEATRSQGRRSRATRSKTRVRARVLPVQGLVRRAGRHAATAICGRRRLHHGLPHAPDHQGRVDHPADPQRNASARASRWSSRRASSARASTRSTSRYSDALTIADHHALYKNGVKEIAAMNGVRRDVHGEVDDGRGGLVLPPALERSGTRTGRESLMWSDEGNDHMTDEFRWYLGGLMATAREMAWMFAPFVNSYKRYQLGSWAPTAIVWSHDNRTCGFRLVGEHTGVPGRVPDPGRRRQPVPTRSRRRSRPGCTASRTRSSRPPMFQGNAYEAKRRAARPDVAARGGRGVPQERGRAARRSATSCSSTC